MLLPAWLCPTIAVGHKSASGAVIFYRGSSLKNGGAGLAASCISRGAMHRSCWSRDEFREWEAWKGSVRRACRRHGASVNT